jgi:hypothetical protein
MTALEEEEAGPSRNHIAKKGAHNYHSSVISYTWSFGRVLHNPQNDYFSMRLVVCCCEATNSWDWALDIDCKRPMVETLRADRKFSIVVLQSSYTRFLSGSPDDPASIHKFGSKSGWVEGSSSYLSLNLLLCLPEIKKKWNFQIQFKKIITYERKWLNKHTIMCWVRLSTNCCVPFWWSTLCTCISTKSSIGLNSRPRVVARKKKYCKLNIFINHNELIKDRCD